MFLSFLKPSGPRKVQQVGDETTDYPTSFTQKQLFYELYNICIKLVEKYEYIMLRHNNNNNNKTTGGLVVKQAFLF
jgi:hypothetical protein